MVSIATMELSSVGLLEREKEEKNRTCSDREESLMLLINSVAKFAIVI